jgi:hypothetical protein
MTGAWLIDGFPDTPDEYDKATAEELTLGRFACHLCADNRDAADRAERELRTIAREMARVEALLAAIRARSEASVPR